MELTQNFVKAKRPCAEGYKWFLRHRHEGSDCQRLLDALVDAGRQGRARGGRRAAAQSRQRSGAWVAA